MEITIIRDIDPLFEVNALLANIAENYSYEELKIKLNNKYRINTRAEEKIDLIAKMFKYVSKNLTVDREKIKFYYKNIGTYSDNLASFVLLYDINNYINTIDDVRNRVMNITEEERMKEFSLRLDGFSKIGLAEEDVNNITLIDLFKKINNSDMDNDSKLAIQRVYLEKEVYLEEILGIVEETLSLMNHFRPEINQFIEEFYQYWNKYTNQKELYKMLKDNLNISFHNNDKGTIVIPGIFYCNSATFTSNGDEEKEEAKKEDVFRFGIVFDDRFNLSVSELNPTAVHQTLKQLSDKSKLEILMLVKKNRAYGSQLAKSLNLSTPTISYHMSSLIQLGLVSVEKVDNKVYYSMNKQRMEEFLKELHQILLE